MWQVEGHFGWAYRHFASELPGRTAAADTHTAGVSDTPAVAARGGARASVAAKMELLELVRAAMQTCDRSTAELLTAKAAVEASLQRETLQRARMEFLLGKIQQIDTVEHEP